MGQVIKSNSSMRGFADDAVTAAKADIYKSDVITIGSSSPKAQAHGLGASPDVFFPVFMAGDAGTDPAMTATADATNVYVAAATPNVKYIIFAWL